MSKSFLNVIKPLILFLLITSCDTNKPIDREAIMDEMASREPKRITQSVFLEKGLELGNALSEKSQQIFQKNLLAAIEEGGINNAIEFCNLNASGLISELQEESGTSIYRTSVRYRNPQNEPDSLELLILEAYGYSQENNLELSPSIIEENEQVLLYTRPISLSKGLCLNCHGTPGKEIADETVEALQGLYPNDQALNYQMGDLRGMWSIRIPKKVIADKL